MKNTTNHRVVHQWYSLFWVMLCIISVHCTSPGNQNKKSIIRDTTISQTNAFSQLHTDSATLENYIKEHQVKEAIATNLRNFYKSRNYYFAWFTEEGLAEQAQSFWNLHNSYVAATADSSLFDKELHQLMDRLMYDAASITLAPEQVAETEIHLSQHFFEYSQLAYEGKVDPSDLQWHIPRKKLDAVALLDSLIRKKDQSIEAWEPVNEPYKKLKAVLQKYHAIRQQGGWLQIVMKGKKLQQGDSAQAVVQLKQRLAVEGDFTPDDRSPLFTPELAMALRQAQQRFGLEVDGVLGANTLAALNVPVEERTRQMLANLERMKWMPVQQGTRLVANIPSFQLQVYENNAVVLEMKIVVGTVANSSAIFADNLEYVVFSPYWNVPSSIVRNEILPAMKRNPGYLQRMNMEQTGTRDGLPVIRQLPGGSNALGRVKFIFPNNYHIYFHDTPSKSLFNRTRRAFSHGCIRLEKPTELAEYLLKDKPEWTSSAIQDAMYAGSEKWVKLQESVPVLISYFTSWVDEEGRVHFRSDLYGHDKKLKDRLF